MLGLSWARLHRAAFDVGPRIGRIAVACQAHCSLKPWPLRQGGTWLNNSARGVAPIYVGPGGPYSLTHKNRVENLMPYLGLFCSLKL